MSIYTLLVSVPACNRLVAISKQRYNKKHEHTSSQPNLKQDTYLPNSSLLALVLLHQAQVITHGMSHDRVSLLYLSIVHPMATQQQRHVVGVVDLLQALDRNAVTLGKLRITAPLHTHIPLLHLGRPVYVVLCRAVLFVVAAHVAARAKIVQRGDLISAMKRGDGSFNHTNKPTQTLQLLTGSRGQS